MVPPDLLVQAHVRHVAVVRALVEARYAQAWAVVVGGAGSAPWRSHSRVTAARWCHLARLHATRGGVDAVARVVDRARRAVDLTPAGATVSGWLRSVDHAGIDAAAAAAYLVAGRYGVAVESAERAVKELPAGRLRDQVHAWLHLAEARLGQREVDQAVTDATTALVLASEHLTGDIRTGRAAVRLRRLRDRFATWPEVPAARDWIATYDDAIARRAGSPP